MSFRPSFDEKADRRSDAPFCVEVGESERRPRERRRPVARISPAWLGMSGYLIGGIVLGLALIAGLTMSRSSGAAASGSKTAAMVTDNVTRLHARDIDASCWHGLARDGSTRLTVSLDVGIDGAVRYAAASGETPAMQACVEAHVKTWAFLPQARPTAMALPIEVDRR